MRMRSSLPKQFILVKEKPVLMHTLERFYHHNPKMELVLTLPEAWVSYWEELVATQDFVIPHKTVVGGAERYDSIKNALSVCYGDIIAVHDGVRPLVNDVTLKQCFRNVLISDGVIPVVPVNQSLRVKEGESTRAVPRSEYLLVQTPQCFRREVIEKAYEQDYHPGITDDATLVEEAGFAIQTVDGNVENIKITTQSDLRYAELFLK